MIKAASANLHTCRPSDFRALFIRAPAVLETSEGVEPLAYYHLTADERKLQVQQFIYM
jgi:glutamine amidotransferase PdxT